MSKKLIFLALLYTATIYADSPLSKSLAPFFQNTKAQELSLELPIKSDSFDWIFYLSEKPANKELQSFLIKHLIYNSANGIIVSDASLLSEIAETYGYVRDQQTEKNLSEFFLKTDVKIPIKVFQKPQIEHFEAALKKIDHKTETSNIKNIDFIYLINLDERPEKWAYCQSVLSPYNINPHRFSAIRGWSLPPQIINRIALRFSPGMEGGRWISYFPLTLQTLSPEYEFLTEKWLGKPCTFNWLSPGAIGCTLSHLSVLQDAYTSGYETIWVLEDDIHVEKDPHILSDLIEKLDNLVGKEGWDVLYTDSDSEDEGEGDRILTDISHIWRPDLPDPSVLETLQKRDILSEDFIRIKSRSRTHSMIIRKSGMKKILDYNKTHRIFIPYDDDLSLVPDIKIFNLRYHCVTKIKDDPISDTEKDLLSQNLTWTQRKQEILSTSAKLIGWQPPSSVAEKIVDFVHRKKPKVCVEIGAFAGLATYRIAATLQFLNQGILYAIDAWDTNLALEGLKGGAAIQTWKNIPMDRIYQEFQNLISSKNMESHCRPIHQDSKKAASLFEDESIDFLYLDGNESLLGSLEDVRLYLPKVKKGGYIWMVSARNTRKHLAADFLMKHCDWIKEESLIKEQVAVFQKKL